MSESVPISDFPKMAKMEKDQVIGVLIQILKKSRKWRNGERSSMYNPFTYGLSN